MLQLDGIEKCSIVVSFSCCKCWVDFSCGYIRNYGYCCDILIYFSTVSISLKLHLQNQLLVCQPGKFLPSSMTFQPGFRCTPRKHLDRCTSELYLRCFHLSRVRILFADSSSCIVCTVSSPFTLLSSCQEEMRTLSYFLN